MEKFIDEFQKKLSWDTHNYVLGASDGDELIGIAGLRGLLNFASGRPRQVRE